MAEYEGQRLGNYTLVRQLGRGGFSSVYLGEHIYLKTQAAIKVVNTHLTSESVESFQQEGRIIAHLIHPNIVRVLEFGAEKDAFYLIMDYAPNGTLRQRHPKGTRVVPINVSSYITQVAEALQYAHDRSLIHRDIKPENMLIGQNHEILLSDFGIAIASQTQNSPSSTTKDVVGTVAYMAPEQLMGKPQRASDQYSLAIVVYEWLCGERPFQGSFTEICQQHLSHIPVGLRIKVPTIPQYLEEVVLKALEKNPQNRFASVLEFAEALQLACEPTQSRFLAENDTVPTISQALLQPPTAPDDAPEIPETISSAPKLQDQPPDDNRIVSQGEQKSKPTTTTAPTNPTLESNSANQLKNLPPGTSFVDALLDKAPAASFLTAEVDNAPEFTFATRPITIKPQDERTIVSGMGTSRIMCQGHTDCVRAIAWSPDGKSLASASNDKTIIVWSTDTGRKTAILRGHSNAIYSLAWSPDKRCIASAGADKTIIVWEALTHRIMFPYRGHAGEIHAIAWSPDGKYIASASADRTIQVWRADSGRREFNCQGHTDWVRAVAWSPDGNYIASAGNDKTIVIWNARTGNKQSSWKGHTDWVRAIAWSPDGKSIASAGNDKTVLIWDVAVGQKILSYPGHTECWLGGVLAVAWSPDGQLIASAGEDQTVQIWHTSSGENIFTYSQHSAPVSAVAWSPDGNCIASADHDKMVQIWKAS